MSWRAQGGRHVESESKEVWSELRLMGVAGRAQINHGLCGASEYAEPKTTASTRRVPACVMYADNFQLQCAGRALPFYEIAHPGAHQCFCEWRRPTNTPGSDICFVIPDDIEGLLLAVLVGNSHRCAETHFVAR